MATQGDIRARFSAAHDKITEKRAEELESLIIESYIGSATTGNKAGQQQLFDTVNKMFRGKKSPWQGIQFNPSAGVKQQPDGRLWLPAMNKNTFKVVFDYLMLKTSDANTLLNLGRDDNAIGAGEIMMAYIVENMKIGGGSADTDLELFDESWKSIKGSSGKCELKEAQLQKGMLANWRTGAKHQGINSKYVPELTKLYDAVKYSIDAINPDTSSDPMTDKGGWINEWGTVGGKRFKHIEGLTKEDITRMSSQDRDFKIGPGGDKGAMVIKYNNEEVGKLSDPKTIAKIEKILASKTSIRTFEEIQKSVISEVGAISTPFLFIESKGSKDDDEEKATRKIIAFHYYERLPKSVDSIKIHSITQGKFKYKIKPKKV